MTKRTIRKIKETALGLLGVTIFFFAIGIAGYIENHYSMDCVVDYYKGEKCIIDEVGMAWSDDRVEEFAVGDTVRVLFDTNTTDSTRYDDIVAKISLAQ